MNLSKFLSFGLEQTYTINEWWSSEGFTSKSDSSDKLLKMHELASELSYILSGHFIKSLDIWGHIQFEVFDKENSPSFIVTMDPGSIEVKTPPVLINQMKDMLQPLVTACNNIGLVPYRNWWYGIKSGTEGGCHINMGGISSKTNPFIQSPDLVIKYASYIHNRPWLTYPFMGVDVGPEGNAIRLDEKQDFKNTQKVMNDYINLYKSGKKLDSKKTYEFFSNTSLAKEKSCAPSIYKFKAPDFLIEDRAQESLRSADEFFLVANLRLKILEMLLNKKTPESLKNFPNIHKENLTSYWLWGNFLNWANDIGLNPIDYQRFFDRQFPKLLMGSNPPKMFGLKEGRRARIVKAVQKRGDVITSKTVDTTYKRFELSYYTDIEEQFDFKIEARGIEFISPIKRHEGYLGFGNLGQAYYKYIDIKYDKENPLMKISLKDKLLGSVIETATFNIHSMMWD